MVKKRSLLALILILTFQALFFVSHCRAIDYRGNLIVNPGRFIGYHKDAGGDLPISMVLASQWDTLEADVPNLGVSTNTHWLSLDLENRTEKDLFLHIPYPVLDEVELYCFDPDKRQIMSSYKTGLSFPFAQRELEYQDFIFPITTNASGRALIMLKVRNNSQTMIPVRIGDLLQINSKLFVKDHFFGIYAGFILVMLLYNLFVYFSTRDKNYLWYLIYIFTVGLTQFTLSGYSHKYLWPDLTWLSRNSVYLCGIASGLGVIFFVKYFLHLRESLPWLNKALNVFITMYGLSFAMLLTGYPSLSYNMINLTAGLGLPVLFVAAVYLARKGFRPARFFLVAWTIFILSVIIFVLKDVDVLPYNSFTVYALPFGSAIEVVLLSLALADKINQLSREKQEARKNELDAYKRNEKLVREQNVILERRVEERTAELTHANGRLEEALKNLQSAQTQLVNQEKMASLGQLTAGIAHEINNPINFVSSNINPLRRDIDDLIEMINKFLSIKGQEDVDERLKEIEAFMKEIDYEYVLEEVDQLLKGIGDGASRTSDLVKSLRNFSRLDEVESKFADIHEGINSTLVIVMSGLKKPVEVIKNFDSSITPIECYPGKLNQVISNILVNAVQAMENTEKPTITITTENLDDRISLTILDNGPGIPPEIKEKIFEPFFTTKEVGEGTGLGLSIVYSIIESHKGSIEVNTVEAGGTEFRIVLSKTLN